MGTTRRRSRWCAAAGLLIGSALFACSGSNTHHGTDAAEDGPVAEDVGGPTETGRDGDGEGIGEDVRSADDRAAGGANPSWRYCEESGGTVAVVYNGGIPIDGICQFVDGTECATWAYLRNECNPGDCTRWDTDAKSCTNASDGGASGDGRPRLDAGGFGRDVSTASDVRTGGGASARRLA